MRLARPSEEKPVDGMAQTQRSIAPSAAVIPLAAAAIKQEVRRDMRLRILQILAVVPAGLTNVHVLKRALREVGHAVSMDLLRGELAWLQEQGYVELGPPAAILIARLTERGQDIGSGTAQHPDVSSASD